MNTRSLLGQILRRPDFLLAIPVGIFGLATFYYWLLLRVSTLSTTISNISAEPAYFTAVKILVPVTLILFGLNFALGILLFRAGGGFRWQGGSLLGGITGGFGAACPICGAFLLSLIGITAGLTALPFAGLEIWTGSVLVMGLSFWGSLRALNKKTCDPKAQAVDCWRLPTIKKEHIFILLVLALGLFVNLNTMLLSNEPSFARTLQPLSGREMNEQKTSEATSGDALFDEVRAKVLPEEGVTLPIRWGDWLPKLVGKGVIDLQKLEAAFSGDRGLTPEQLKLLKEGSSDFITINNKNSWFLVTLFWPLGLSNQLEINRASPILGDSLFNFASTGGWTLGRAENGGTYFNKYKLLKLTPEQEDLVKELGEGSYRPCCNNSTFYQDCNHGSALLGLLELGASQGLSREELSKAALIANSFWFPQNYLQTAAYMKAVRGIDWENVNPEEVLGADYSSGTGAAKVAKELSDRGLLPQSKSGTQCGV